MGNLIKKIKEVHNQFMNLESEHKLALLQTGTVMFCLLFSYPFFRATTTSLLLTSFGAKGSPYAWTFSVLTLTLIVFGMNKLQMRRTVRFIFATAAITTVILFGSFYFLLQYQSNFWAFPLYVLKEVYIVILVHSTIGYLNASVPKEVAEVAYGPFGAIGSLGGIIGAFLTGYISKSWPAGLVLLSGSVVIILATLIFTRTGNKTLVTQKKERRESSLHSIRGAGKYVALMAIIVASSQFVINIGNYQFNIFLENHFSTVADKQLQTSFLGQVYGWINVLSLVIQVFLIPLILRYVSHRWTHIAIPVIYGFLAFFSLMGGAGVLGIAPAVLAFVSYKGLDYSIFSAAKELLYFGLSDLQKYGAKYIVDMIVYRLSKGLISVILILLPQSLISYLLYLCIGLWLAAIFPLFKMIQPAQASDKIKGDLA